jgi:hypothetical protein
VLTDRDEWLEWGQLCKGFEDQVFGDPFGLWGQEDSGAFDAPVYNHFWMFIMGKESQDVSKKNTLVVGSPGNTGGQQKP